MPASCAADLFASGADLLARREVSAAIECFNQAESHRYDRNLCAAKRWECWMLLGDFERAWQESDLIAKSTAHDPNRFWDGSCWLNRNVMVRCLHGLGDTIQFIRYAPLLRDSCRRLTVQTHPQLVRLLEGVDGIDQVTSWGPGYAEDAEWDMQMEVTELPRAFRTTVSSIPASFPYICVPRHKIFWASKFFDNLPAKVLRVGVAWQAGEWNPERSIPVGIFSRLFEDPNCVFYCLQKGVSEQVLEANPLLRNVEANAADVLDTASLMANLDLIISVDTMTAHLAGALGLPVWIILPAAADWRWMMNRADSPWYPSARLFRRGTASWLKVIQEVLGALEFAKEASKYTCVCTNPDLV